MATCGDYCQILLSQKKRLWFDDTNTAMAKGGIYFFMLAFYDYFRAIRSFEGITSCVILLFNKNQFHLLSIRIIVLIVKLYDWHKKGNQIKRDFNKTNGMS